MAKTWDLDRVNMALNVGSRIEFIFGEYYLNIRKIKIEDIPQLEKLFLKTRIQTFHWQNPNNFNLSDFEKYVEDEEVFVAVEDEKIVGFISIYLPNNFIHNLFIHPKYQRTGIGKLLLEKILTFIVEPITLKVEILNINACMFYEKFGFKKISVHENEEKPYYLYEYRQV